MSQNNKNKFWLISAVVIYGLGLIFIKNFFENKTCTPEDVWTLKEDWGVCSQDGLQRRVYVTNDNITCIQKGEIQEPMSVKSCVPDCTENDFQGIEWSNCDEQTKQQTRSLIPLTERAKNNQCINNLKTIQSCIPSVKKQVSLFPKYGYRTEIDLNQKKDLEYTPNINNIYLQIGNGKFKNITLKYTVATTILDGSLIKRDSPYYVMFSINDKIPRILESERKVDGNISFFGPGTFNGLDIPKSFNWDLNNIHLAKAKNPPEGVGSVLRKYTDEVLNKNLGKTIPMTLYVGGGGRGMTEPDEKKRIFGKITEAYLEYECETESDCSILVQ